MFTVSDRSRGKVIGLRVDGKLVHADYQKFVPMLEEIIARHGGLRCFCELTNFKGITPHALWDEIKFDTKHCKDIERCAIVGDKHSHKWMTNVGQAIFRTAEMKYFDVGETEAAWQWINEGLAAADASEETEETAAG